MGRTVLIGALFLGQIRPPLIGGPRKDAALVELSRFICRNIKIYTCEGTLTLPQTLQLLSPMPSR